jgi:hypothetical protein
LVAGSAHPPRRSVPYRSSRCRRPAPSMRCRRARTFAMAPTSGDRHGWSEAESSRNGAPIDSQHLSQQHSQQCSQTSPRDDLWFDHPLWKGLRASATHSNTHSNTHSKTHSNTHRPSSQPCEWKGAVGATRLGIGLLAGTEEGVHAFRDHRAVVTFGVLRAKAHNDPRRRYGSQL